MIYSEEEAQKIKKELYEKRTKISKALLELDEFIKVVKDETLNYLLNKMRNELQSNFNSYNCHIGLIESGYRGAERLEYNDSVIHAWSDGRTEVIKSIR